ncbi:hypothetical protein BB561_003828, partial [Smittium simulii]
MGSSLSSEDEFVNVVDIMDVDHVEKQNESSIITEGSFNTKFITLSQIANKDALDVIIDAHDSHNSPKIYQVADMILAKDYKKNEQLEKKEKIKKNEKPQVIDEFKNKTSKHGKSHHKVLRVKAPALQTAGLAPARDSFTGGNPGSIAPISLPTAHPSADGAATGKRGVTLVGDPEQTTKLTATTNNTAKPTYAQKVKVGASKKKPEQQKKQTSAAQTTKKAPRQTKLSRDQIDRVVKGGPPVEPNKYKLLYFDGFKRNRVTW